MTGTEYVDDPLTTLRREFPHVGIIRTPQNIWIACFGKTATVRANSPSELREKLVAAAFTPKAR
jgi:hypothetical protein